MSARGVLRSASLPSPPKTTPTMNALKLIAAVAIASMTTAMYAQTDAVATEAQAPGNDAMAMVSKQLNLSADQQATFTKLLSSCDKDCAAIASKGGEKVGDRKMARFDRTIAAMKDVLNPDQQKMLDTMKAKGELSGLCASGGKACCAGKSAKGCCAGKAHAEEKAPAKVQ